MSYMSYTCQADLYPYAIHISQTDILDMSQSNLEEQAFSL